VDTVAAPGSIANGDYQSAFEALIAAWRDAAAFAQQFGVRMVWEFEPGFSFNKPSEVLAMHQKVAHPNFWVLFDTAHAHMCGVVGARQHGAKETLRGGVSEFLDKLKGRIGAIHLIDSDGTLHGDETSTHRPFGEGFIDFRALAPKLLDVPKIDWWCIDMCFWAGSWGLVEPSLEFVRKLFDAHAVVA
jgi:sugar phosphate isomerase/epimerase